MLLEFWVDRTSIGTIFLCSFPYVELGARSHFCSNFNTAAKTSSTVLVTLIHYQALPHLMHVGKPLKLFHTVCIHP
jgi:hypothetical protein